MAKKPKFPAIPTREWDFREIPESEIQEAYEHEIHREITNPVDPSEHPWLDYGPVANAEYAARLKKFGNTVAVRQIVPGGKLSGALTRLVFEISLPDHSKEEILAAVSEAIDKSGMLPSMAKRGMAGKRSRFELLKRLSAYRLNKAGFTFGLAQEFLQVEQFRFKISGWPSVWPVYSNPPAWTTAVNSVRKAVEVDQACNEEEKVLIARQSAARGDLL